MLTSSVSKIWIKKKNSRVCNTYYPSEFSLLRLFQEKMMIKLKNKYLMLLEECCIKKTNEKNEYFCILMNDKLVKDFFSSFLILYKKCMRVKVLHFENDNVFYY